MDVFYWHIGNNSPVIKLYRLLQLIITCTFYLIIEINVVLWRLVGGRLDQCSINRRCHGRIAFGH